MGLTERMIKSFVHSLGYEIIPLNNPDELQEKCDLVEYAELCQRYADRFRQLGITKAHYGSGPRLFGTGWINIDVLTFPLNTSEVHVSINLASRHPFPSDFFQFAFAEDFIEHLDQAESLLFLSEVFRTLRQLDLNIYVELTK
jgi:hypothetical protein